MGRELMADNPGIITRSDKLPFYPSIDILRGFAAVSVVVYHVIHHFSWKSFPFSGLLSWFRVGGMAVDLFFVISGFVIGLASFYAVEVHGRSGFRLPFITRRFWRLAPLHYLTLLLYLLLVVPEKLHWQSAANIATHVFFIHSFWVDYFGDINGVNWSIAIEMQFYLLILLLAPWLRAANGWKIAFFFIAIAWTWRWLAVLFVPIDGPQRTFPLFVASAQLPGMLDEFALGILLAKFLQKEIGKKLLMQLQDLRVLLAFMVVVGGLFYLVMNVYWKNGPYWHNPFMVVFFKTPLAMVFALVVLLACSMNATRWLKITAPLQYLGTISYGVYLWHLPVIIKLKEMPPMAPGLVLAIVLGVTLVLAVFSWHFFEKLLLKMGKNSSFLPERSR